VQRNFILEMYLQQYMPSAGHLGFNLRR